MKKPKKSYDTENSNFNLLDFLINHLLFIFTQFKLAETFKDKEELKKLKFCFHVVLGRSEEEEWPSMKVIRVVSIVQDVLFESIL